MWWDDREIDKIISESDSAGDGDEASAKYCAEITDSSTQELVSSWNQALSDSTNMDD